MKKLLVLFLCLSIFCFTSCIDIVEEMYLNKDGSGRYLITVDMSALMEGGGIRSMLKEFSEMGGDEGSTPEMDNLDLDEPLEMDTLFTFENAPDSVREKFDDPELLKRMRMKIQMSEAKEKMEFAFEFDFNNLDEIDDFYKNLSKMQEENTGMMGQSSMLPIGQKALFEINRRTLTRLPAPKGESAFSEEEKGMAEMLFSGATYTTIYHLPGKVKSASHPDAEIDGKTVTIAVPMLDMMDGKAKLDGSIKFKRR